MITISDLTYQYPRQAPTLRGLHLHVPAGSIYGFLGANGAGKSTTIRNLLGLCRPQRGSIQLFGHDLEQHRRAILSRVGFLIEAPALYPQLNAIDNLRIACSYRRVGPARIAPVLDLVGLTGQEKKITRKYSMGMKQRLGLALALLHDPELLILDEPVNGLDPAGIADVRQLLQQLQAEGKTILLSSHLLLELEKTVSHLGILRDGQMAFEGTLTELEAARSANFSVIIQTPHVRLAVKVLGLATTPEQGELQLSLPNRAALPATIKTLVDAGVDLYAVRPLAGDLESLFLDLTTPTS